MDDAAASTADDVAVARVPRSERARPVADLRRRADDRRAGAEPARVRARTGRPGGLRRRRRRLARPVRPLERRPGRAGGRARSTGERRSCSPSSRGGVRETATPRARSAPALVAWVAGLRAVFDEAREHPSAAEDAETSASAPAFEGATVTRPARILAAHAGPPRRCHRARARPCRARLRRRRARALLPGRSTPHGWAGVVLAAAVRAYVPAIDPHGAWAPLDEESSVYEVDLEAHPPPRLWDKAERTAIGSEIESGATPPLADGDVVLSLAGVPTAGLSYEQTEQLGFAASDARPPARGGRPARRRASTRRPSRWTDTRRRERSGSQAAAAGRRRAPRRARRVRRGRRHRRGHPRRSRRSRRGAHARHPARARAPRCGRSRASSSTCAATAAGRPTAPSTRSGSSFRARRSFR